MEIANETQLINQENKFVIKNISRQTFERVIEWMKTHIGIFSVIITHDELGNQLFNGSPGALLPLPQKIFTPFKPVRSQKFLTGVGS